MAIGLLLALSTQLLRAEDALPAGAQQIRTRNWDVVLTPPIQPKGGPAPSSGPWYPAGSFGLDPGSSRLPPGCAQTVAVQFNDMAALRRVEINSQRELEQSLKDLPQLSRSDVATVDRYTRGASTKSELDNALVQLGEVLPNTAARLGPGWTKESETYGKFAIAGDEHTPDAVCISDWRYRTCLAARWQQDFLTVYNFDAALCHFDHVPIIEEFEAHVSRAAAPDVPAPGPICAERLQKFVAELDDLLAANPSTLSLESLKKYLPLKGCDADQAIDLMRSSKYLAAVWRHPYDDVKFDSGAASAWPGLGHCGGYRVRFILDSKGDSRGFEVQPNDSCLTTIRKLPNENFALYAVPSIGIFAVFAALGMWNRRTAWFISLSAPGAIVMAIVIPLMLADLQTPQAYIVAVLFGSFLLPALWIFPLVFVIQVRNLFKRKTDIMSPYSYLGAGALLGLYFWTDAMLKALNSS